MFDANKNYLKNIESHSKSMKNNENIKHIYENAMMTMAKPVIICFSTFATLISMAQATSSPQAVSALGDTSADFMGKYMSCELLNRPFTKLKRA